MSAMFISVPRSKLAAALVAVTGLAGAGPTPVNAQTAPLITGLEKTQSPVVVDSRPFKSAVATCNGNKKVVGGGGWAFSVSATDEERLALTQLEPKDDVDGRGTDGYIASAAETAPGLNGNWWVQAYALCADASSVHGWRIVPKYTPTLSLPVQRIAAGCDNSRQRVLGTGARVESFVKGEVVLQVARSDGRGGIARAQAHEDADGYSGTWWLGAFAICADTPGGL